MSKRQAQRLAASPGGLDGVRVGRAWALAKAPVLTLANEGDGMTTGPTDPSSWRPAGAPEPDAAPPIVEALLLALDSFVASLSESDFRALVERTRERTSR